MVLFFRLNYTLIVEAIHFMFSSLGHHDLEYSTFISELSLRLGLRFLAGAERAR